MMSSTLLHQDVLYSFAAHKACALIMITSAKKCTLNASNKRYSVLNMTFLMCKNAFFIMYVSKCVGLGDGIAGFQALMQ